MKNVNYLSFTKRTVHKLKIDRNLTPLLGKRILDAFVVEEMSTSDADERRSNNSFLAYNTTLF